MTEPSRDNSEFVNDLYNTHQLYDLRRNSAQSAEYQRQQLNLLREHQGLPPIPPPPPYNYVGNVLSMVFKLFAFLVVAGLALWVLLFIGTVVTGHHNP